jgi:hypothetical protein
MQMRRTHGAKHYTTRENAMKTKMITMLGACLLLLCACIMPAVSAGPATGVVPDTAIHEKWNENPDAIAAVKAATAYLAELGKARMDGAIQYIGSISSGGASTLTADKTTFVSAADSAQSATTVDGVRDARSQMKTAAQTFRADTRSIMQENNGSARDLRMSVNASVKAEAATLETLKNSAWQNRETARMGVFDNNEGRRNGVLANLTAKGIDVSAAQDIEGRIQQQGASLEAGFATHDKETVKSANGELKELNKQFRETVKGYRDSSKDTVRASRGKATTSGPVQVSTNSAGMLNPASR